MAQATDARLASISESTIRVGTTGTIGSLMTWELDSMKLVKQEPEFSSHLKHRPTPASVPCSASSRRLQPRRNSGNDANSSRSSRRLGDGGIIISSGRGSHSSNSGDVAPMQRILIHDVTKTRQAPGWKNGWSSPVRFRGGLEADGAKTKERTEKRGRHVFIVEVVDIKCNNPMSNRLRKLGFSRLSETIA